MTVQRDAGDAEWMSKLPAAVHVGLFARHLERGDTIAVGADQLFPAASTIKIPIMMAAYRQVQGHKLAWNEEVVVRPEDQVDPDSALHIVPGGSSCAVRELVRLMITVSDNIATNLLIGRLGMEAVNRHMAALGLRQSVLRRHMLDQQARSRGQDNVTTAAEMAQLMELLGRHGVRGWRSMLRLMQGQQDREKIPDHLATGLTIANKPGELPGFGADVALVQAPIGSFVLSVFVAGIPGVQETDALIGRLARAVYQRFANRTSWGSLRREW